jgi:hypothetical protein
MTLMARGVGGVLHNLRAAGLAMLLIMAKYLLTQRQSPKKAVDRVKGM